MGGAIDVHVGVNVDMMVSVSVGGVLNRRHGRHIEMSVVTAVESGVGVGGVLGTDGLMHGRTRSAWPDYASADT